MNLRLFVFEFFFLFAILKYHYDIESNIIHKKL